MQWLMILNWLKVPDPKYLENELSLNWQIWSLVSYQNIIHGEKIANVCLSCKQFEKTMLICFINGRNHVF